MDPNEISTCEKMVMKVIWDSTEDLDLQRVMENVNREFNKEWKPQTVSTFLSRLTKKGYLNVYRRGRYSYYQPAVAKTDYKMSTVAESIEYFDHGNVAAFVCGMFDSIKLTKEEKERIKKKIDELE